MAEQRINHLYDFYELYGALYSREYPWKAAEGRGLGFAMAHAAVRSKKLLAQGKPALNFEVEGFNLMEIFSGRGEHHMHMKLPEALKINSYQHNDMRDHSEVCPDFIQGDSTTTTFEGRNFIAALFYSMSSLHDEHGNHDRKLLLKLFKNMYDNLPAGGAFFADFCSDGYNMSLAVDDSDSEDFTEVSVDSDSPIRTALNIPYHVQCTISYKKRSVYNRVTATCSDFFTTPITVTAGSRTVAEVYVQEPMTQRYFSEPELIDIAKEAGFTDFMFFSLDYSDADFTKLDNVLESEDGIDTDEVDGYMANAFIAFK